MLSALKKSSSIVYMSLKTRFYEKGWILHTWWCIVVLLFNCFVILKQVKSITTQLNHCHCWAQEDFSSLLHLFLQHNPFQCDMSQSIWNTLDIIACFNSLSINSFLYFKLPMELNVRNLFSFLPRKSSSASNKYRKKMSMKK